MVLFPISVHHSVGKPLLSFQWYPCYILHRLWQYHVGNMLSTRCVGLFLLLLFPYFLLQWSLFFKVHACVHAFWCNCSIITFLRFALDCHMKVFFGLNNLICLISGGVFNSVIIIELFV